MDEDGHIGLKLLVAILTMFYFVTAPPLLMAAVFMLFIAETTSTILFSTAVTILLSLPAILLYYNQRILPKRKVYISLGCILTAFSLISASYFLTASGRPLNQNSEIRSIFPGEDKYCRGSIANLVPEIDQFKFGSYTMPFVDSHIDYQKSKRLRALFMNVYGEMRQDENYHELGSVMNHAYKGLYSNSTPARHFYIYQPTTGRGKKVPLIVFLHGSGGNFKAYMWQLKSLAEKSGALVVAPSFGLGQWDNEGAEEAVKQAVDYCTSSGDYSIGKKFLIGLSGGGSGVYRLGKSMADDFHGLGFISPVMYSAHADDDDLIERWNGKNMLVVSGKNDLRVPQQHVRFHCDALLNGRVNIKIHWFESDHYLMYTEHWQEISRIFAEWILLEVKAPALEQAVIRRDALALLCG